MICARDAWVGPSGKEEGEGGRGRREAGGGWATIYGDRYGVGQSSALPRRFRFLSEWRFLDSRRASFAARVGLVALRLRGTIRARRTVSARRSSASSRLRS